MPSTTKSALETACALIDQGDIAEAITLLEQLIATRPPSATTLQMLGLVYAMIGNMRAAARVMRQACVLEPDNGSLRRHLARAEWQIGMPAQAAASYDHAIACGCVFPELRVDYAVALQALKQYPAALVQCEQAIAADPSHARAWGTRARLLHQQNRLDEALACHERATTLSPSARAWSARGVTLHAMNDFKGALDCHDKALACDLEDATVWNQRGVTLAKMGQHQQALDCHIRATVLDPALACAWSNLGAMLLQQQRGDEALAAHDKAVSLQPSSAALWLQRGISLMMLKRDGEALASFNAAVRLDPASAMAWYYRGTSLRFEGRLPEALESLEEAIQLDPVFACAIMLRAEVLQLLGGDAESLTLPEQAVLATPGSHRLRPEALVDQLAHGNFADSWKNVSVVTVADAELRYLPFRAANPCRGAA